ncbi:putative protein with domain of unknown function (DUF3835) [Lyophyllum shimeji]|uniref:DUF3835 domain-containing protein n=1 Tax=Lyophyllum shimeji TaxID=47721 RepID=A0A9P3UIP2_LYOSH|nr:putative protein with domain of unknown function (DUF3835) [Lyophyllum shimeji]
MSDSSQITGQGSISSNRRNEGTLTGLSADAIKKLTDKLSEMMGEDVTQGFEPARNERGELLNEEGLPIIDITEPLSTTTETPISGNAIVTEDTMPPRLSNLPEAARERLRQQRDRILDQLEEEEWQAQKREEEVDLEQRQEILRKRKEAAAKEKEKLKANKDMQKKMGRALVGNAGIPRAQEDESSVIELVSDDVKRSSRDEKPARKSVAFADVPKEPDESQKPPTAQRHSLDWGDLTPGRLCSNGRPTLVPADNSLPMKMTVVERMPRAPPKTATTVFPPDSDDESDLEYGPVGGEPDGDTGYIDQSDTELALEDEEYDFDFAQHQREIALEYHEKRSKIGAAARAAMTSHSHDANGDARVDIPLDVPSSQPEKPSISRFKAEHLVSSYNAATSPSTSLGASVVPASTARTLQNAIRTGKLDTDGRLVGGDADSASEDETEGMQELLELLQKGELYNLGPEGTVVVPPSTSQALPTAASSPAASSSAGDKTPFADLPPINRPKTSKFKLSRASAGRPSGPGRPLEPATSASVVEGPSPKPPTPMASTVLERSSAKHPSATTTPAVTEKSSPRPPSVVTPTVAERRPATTTPNPAGTPPTFPSMIVDSPSFAPPSASPRGTAAPTSPMIVDSPSFAKPAPTSPSPTSRPSRPPTVISSSAVRESTRAPAASATAPSVSQSQARPGKVSRFMAERS